MRMEEEVFESKDDVDENDSDIKVNVEIELKSISSFVRKYPDKSLKMWKRQRANMEKGNLEGPEVNNFLHDVLKKWHEFRSPKDGSTLFKAQTKKAVADLKKVIFSAQPGEILNQQVLTEEYWVNFINQMKNVEICDAKVSPISAFETFAGKLFDPADTGALTRGIDNANIETPLQRHQRLESEIAVFEHTLTEFLDEKESPITERDRTTLASMIEDLSRMSSDLGGLTKHLNDKSQSPQDSNLSSELDNDLAMSRSYEATEPAVFTLLKSGGGDTLQVKKLDDRLTKLEGVLGESSKDFTVTSLKELSNLDLLVDPSKFEAIERRINGLSQHLERLKTKNSHLLKFVLTKRASEKPDKLLERMSEYDKNINKLPLIMDRLQRQQPINVQIAGAVGQINTLQAQQKVLSSTLEESKHLLTSVLKNISLNMEKIQANVSSLEGRISRLAH